MKVKVTRLGTGYGCILTDADGIEVDRQTARTRREIGAVCRDMLRWQSKLGSSDPFADAARVRIKN